MDGDLLPSLGLSASTRPGTLNGTYRSSTFPGVEFGDGSVVVSLE